MDAGEAGVHTYREHGFCLLRIDPNTNKKLSRIL